MELSDIFESSPSFTPYELGLDKYKTNENFTNELLKVTSKQVIKSFTNGLFTLYEFPQKYTLIDHTDDAHPVIIYYVQFDAKYNRYIGERCVMNVMLWRNYTYHEVNGLSKDIFFNYLLEKYKVISTDSMQMSDGQRFWDNRIQDAFDLGTHVYYVDMLKPRETGFLEIKNLSEYRDITRRIDIWGDVDKHQARRILISKNKL